MTGLTGAKADLRRRMRAIRDAIPADERARYSATAAEHAIGRLGQRRPASLAAYSAIRSEIDPAAVVAWAHASGIFVALPAMIKRIMEFRPHPPGGALAPGVMGILEPPAGPAAHPDTWLVPLLAFDGRGGRLGYGAGNYDRAVTRAASAGRRPFLVGFAFSAQHVDRIPLEPHDQRLDAVVTEQGALDFGQDD